MRKLAAVALISGTTALSAAGTAAACDNPQQDPENSGDAATADQGHVAGAQQEHNWKKHHRHHHRWWGDHRADDK
jgi:hypothetical protein